MPDVRLARPLLEINKMKLLLPNPAAIEPMVDARRAANALNLPLHYFTKPRSRVLKRIPFYQIGRTIRFRLSELDAWTSQHRLAPDLEGTA